MRDPSYLSFSSSVVLFADLFGFPAPLAAVSSRVKGYNIYSGICGWLASGWRGRGRKRNVRRTERNKDR
jgi:hypothetical protein